MKKAKPRFMQSLQTRLIVPLILVLSLIFMVNVGMFMRVNHSIDHLNTVYSTSVEITRYGNTLNGLQKSFTEYVNTSSDEALREYEDWHRALSTMVPSDVTLTDRPTRILEKNIRSMTLSYLALMDASVSKKNADDAYYKKDYLEASKVYQYLVTNIRALDILRFQNNSENYETVYASLRTLEQFILLALIVMSCVLVLLVSLFLRTIIRPLRLLAEQAREAEAGNLDVKITAPPYHDEVGVLAAAFEQMLRAIRQNILEIRAHAERELEMKERELVTANLLKDAELKYYQAQISPHFLFNTLNAGQQLAMMEGAERTYSFMENTAEFFRGQLRNNGSDSTIRDEIELVENYMYIMNVRFGNEYQVVKKLNEKLLGTRFPGMVLQPIVENTIHYAFPEWPEEREKKIIIHVYTEDGRVVVDLQDNGIGITEEKIHDIMTGPVTPTQVGQSARPQGNGVGLRNVRERLRLFYNQEGVFTIDSEGEDGGTRVRIVVPREADEAGA